MTLPAISETNCINCAQGKYSITLAAILETSCIHCLQGKYSKQSGASSQTTCIDCLAGKFLNDNSSNGEQECIVCPVGKSTQGLVAQTQCFSCLPGTYAGDVNGNAQCDQCPVNTFSTELEATSVSTCNHCTNRKVAIPGSTKCETCQYGMYKPLTSDICMPCLDQHFCAN